MLVELEWGVYGILRLVQEARYWEVVRLFDRVRELFSLFGLCNEHLLTQELLRPFCHLKITGVGVERGCKSKGAGR